MHRAEKILRSIIASVLALICFLEMLLYIPGIWGHEAVVVSSGSMEPAVMTGSIAYINHNDKEISAGKIMAFQLSETVPYKVIHRIHIVNEDGTAVTKGDANDTSDSPLLKKEQVIGSYLFSIPYLGYVINIMDGPIRYLLIPIILMMAGFLFLPDYQVRKDTDTE